jgi:hypothetical protein
VQRQLPADRRGVLPPDVLGQHLVVAGAGQGHLVVPDRARDDDTVRGGQDALAAAGTDVDTEKEI